jgi:hypothetical protein
VIELLALVLFYGYVGLLILAGAWGVVGARIDHRLLMGLDIATLPAATAASVLSQYRFLRAMELGFGLFAFGFRHEIFTQPSFNSFFLAIMLLGVIARVISIVLDGAPRRVFYVFLLSEAAGVIFIFLHTRTTLGVS